MRILLVVYDNESYVNSFPIGLAHIASEAKDMGCDVEIYNQDIHHFPENHLTEFLDKNIFDLIGVGVIGGYYQYKKLLSISNAINKSKNRPFFVIGGHGPSPEPGYFLKKTQADVAVIGEGELTFRAILNSLASNKAWQNIEGIAYRKQDVVVVNPRRALIGDVNSIHMPAYELFPMEIYRLIRLPGAGSTDFVGLILSGRGCPFKCTFCYRMDEGFRPRDPESILREISYLNQNYGINFIGFHDELLMSSEERTELLCNEFIKSGMSFRWFCNGRLNYAKPSLLRLMKKAGCVFINYGIESMDQDVLNKMKKGLTVNQIRKGIEATLDCGINPGLNFIFGNIGDNRETLQKSVEFLLKYDDQGQRRTIRPVTPYPGTELYYKAIEMGLLTDCEDFYERKHLNSDLLSVNFTDLSDEEFHESLREANTKLMENYYDKQFLKTKKEIDALYLNKNSNFRGFR